MDDFLGNVRAMGNRGKVRWISGLAAECKDFNLKVR